jgi:hypothetical protein
MAITAIFDLHFHYDVSTLSKAEGLRLFELLSLDSERTVTQDGPGWNGNNLEDDRFLRILEPVEHLSDHSIKWIEAYCLGIFQGYREVVLNTQETSNG